MKKIIAFIKNIFSKKVEEDYSQMTKAELKAKAKELGIKVDMRKKKEEIIKDLSK